MSKSKFLGLLGSLVLAVVVAVPARAADAAPRSYAVLVGISKYDDSHILPRPHAEADVKALYDLFKNKRYMGLEEGNMKLLLGGKDESRPSEPATHANIVKALNWLADHARPNDLVIFTFVGSGAPQGEKNCYFAVDSTFKGRAKDAVSASEIEKAFAKVKSQKFCILVDVNFKGFDSGKAQAPDVNLNSLYRELLGKEEEGSYSSRAVFLANSGLRASVDLKNHGVFTKVLLDGLKGKADRTKVLVGDAKGKYEADGLVTVSELADYLRKEIPELAKKFGKTEDDKKQKPLIVEGQWSDFVLARDPQVLPEVEKRLAQLNKLASDGAISKEVAVQGRDLLSRMPKLKARQELRLAFQELVDGKVKPEEFLKKRADILARTELSKEDARDYALAILKATRILKAGYFKEVNQGQLVAWAIQGLYRKVEESVPPKIQDRLANAKQLKEYELLRLLIDARTYLGKREDLAKGKDVTYTLTPMLAHLDKHTDYISPEILAQFKIETTGEFYGIGAHIQMNTNKDMLQIVSPIYGSPAYKAKLFAGDIVTKIIRLVDDKGRMLPKPEEYSTKGMPTDKAVKLIKGKAGTPVKLIVEREGVDHPLEFTINRGRVEVESVLGYKRKPDDRWSYYVDPENKIAYVRLTQFARNTFRDLRKVMKDLQKEGVNGMVLDLRFNPGGLLDSAVKISDLFIDDGVIVTIKPRVGQETVYIGKHEESYLDFPMVCLVNDGSASGSEIVSACLQDHGRAIIGGQRSYGKGSVQQIMPFEPTGGELKMTNATFWRPSGKNLNKASTQGREEDTWGVTPDKGFLLKMSIREQDQLFDFMRQQEIIHRHDVKAKTKPDFKDKQLDLALKYLREQIKTTAKENSAKKAG